MSSPQTTRMFGLSDLAGFAFADAAFPAAGMGHSWRCAPADYEAPTPQSIGPRANRRRALPHEFEIARLPHPVERWCFGAVDAEIGEPAFAGEGLDPVVFAA